VFTTGTDRAKDESLLPDLARSLCGE